MSDPALAPTPVHVFADRAWQQFLELNPLWATMQGDERWDDRLDDPGPAGRAAMLALAESWEAEMDGFASLELGVEDQITVGLIRFAIARFRGAHELRLWELEAMDQYSGPQGLIGELARMQRANTPERFERLLARIEAYPAWMAAHRANLDEGVAAGRTAAPAVVERCLTQTRRMVETPAEQSPVVLVNADLTPGDRARLIQAVEQSVLPAQREWLAMLEAYAPHARSGDGVCYLDDGAAIYRHAVLSWTTLEEDPQVIHDYGLARLEEIDAREQAIATELGFEDVAAEFADLNLDMGVSPLPGLETSGAGQIGGGAWFMTNTGTPEEQAGAWEFVKFINELESQKLMHLKGSYLPARQAVAEDPDVIFAWEENAAGQWLKVAVDQFNELDPEFPGPQIGPYTETRQALKEMLEAVILTGTEPAVAIDAAEAEVNDALEAYEEANF